MNNRPLRIALTGAVHPNMPGDDEGLYERISRELAALQTELGFELQVLPDVLRNAGDADQAASRLKEGQPDFILFFCASLPYGRTILPFAELGIPLGIWSVPEPVSSGVLQLNSFCGLNMLGSILQNYFTDRTVLYKWFYGYPEDPRFRERLELTVRALRGVHALKTCRIGQIGELADGFENLYVDERVLYGRFGTSVGYRHSVEDIVRRAESYTEAQAGETLGEILAESGQVRLGVSSRDMDKFARINRALEEFARENRYDSLAVSCWSKFQEVYDVAVCGAMSRLNSLGIAAPCEADISSAVTMILLNALNGDRASLNDMVALDEADNSLNLWHCGVAPGCWADGCGVAWDNHFNIGHYEGREWKGRGVVADMHFRPGDVTLAAMDTDFRNLLVITGRIMEDKPGYAGSSGWVNELKVGGREVTIPDLIQTISIGRVNHHYPSALGHLEGELREFAFWTGMEILEAVPCTPYMQSFRK